MRYSIDIELYLFDTSVGVKEYVEASSIPVLRKKATALIAKKIREMKKYEK